jgi:hypothetical protein
VRRLCLCLHTVQSNAQSSLHKRVTAYQSVGQQPQKECGLLRGGRDFVAVVASLFGALGVGRVDSDTPVLNRVIRFRHETHTLLGGSAGRFGFPYHKTDSQTPLFSRRGFQYCCAASD